MVRLTGRQATNYQGVQASSPPNFQTYNRPPTTTDWQNFYLGDLWEVTNINIPQNQFVYILVSLRSNIAIWVRFAGGNGSLISLTSNTGGTVFGDINGNINTLGDGTTITGVGNPATNTITFSVIGGMAANTFVSSVVATPTVTGGTATPIVGVINVQSSHNLNVSAGLPNTPAVNDIIYWTTNVSTWGDLANVTAGNFSIQAFTGDVTITANNGIGNLNLPVTIASGNAGVVTQGGTGFANRLLHTYGTHNIFLGSLSGNNTLATGMAIGNIGIGLSSLVSINNATGNTIIGHTSGVALTNGESNVAVGNQTLNTEVAGAQNIAIGVQAMYQTLGAFQNVAIGTQALDALQGGSLNTCVGHNAGNNYTANESHNVIIGQSGGVATEQNTIRITTNTAVSDQNIFIGQNNPGSAITVGAAINNTCIGSNSAIALTTGASNSSLGLSSFLALTTGSSNTAIGNISLIALTTGSFNTCLGQGSGLNYTSSESSNILLANTGTVSESNTIRIGQSTGTGAGQQNRFFGFGIRGITTGVADAIAVVIDSSGQLGTVSSSARFKENIKPIGDITESLYKLNPVQFNYKSYSTDKINYGLIAEEVDQVMPRLVVYDKDDIPETIRYNEFIPLLLNELQRLNKRIKFLEDKQN